MRGRPKPGSPRARARPRPRAAASAADVADAADAADAADQAACAGNFSQNVVRTCGSLSTPHVPPWFSMIERTIARPSPVPDAELCRAGSTR